MSNRKNSKFSTPSDARRFVLWVAAQPDGSLILTADEPVREASTRLWRSERHLCLTPSRLFKLDALPSTEMPMPVYICSTGHDFAASLVTQRTCVSPAYARTPEARESKEIKAETNKEADERESRTKGKEKEENKKEESKESKERTSLSSPKPTTSRARGLKNASKEEAEKRLRERQQEFWKELLAYVPQYGQDYVTGFFGYWSERTARAPRMRCETCKTWETAKRLARWNPDRGDEQRRAIAADLRRKSKARAEAERQARELSEEAMREESRRADAARDEARRNASTLDDARRDPRYWEALGQPMPDEYK